MTVSLRRGTSTPRVRVSPRRRLEANEFLRYPSSSATFRTWAAAADRELVRSSKARLAVEMLTPLAAATSLSVTTAPGVAGSIAVLLFSRGVTDTLFLLVANVLLTVSCDTCKLENVPANALTSLAALPPKKQRKFS
jgi:hypothetical protein